jgi:hypothetical protein
VVRIDPMNLDPGALAAADLLVLAHPGKLAAEQINLLAGLMRRGRPMFYIAAETVDATNLKLLMEAAGSDLRMPVEFMPPPAGQLRRNLFVAEVRPDTAPFGVFGQDLPAVLGALRFSGGLTSRPLESGLADDVRAIYSDRSACVVITPCGAGMLAVLNADLAASSLPVSPAFVPLVGEIIDTLLVQRRADASAACGEPMAAYVPGEAGTSALLKLAGPDAAASDLGELVDDAGFVLWRWNSAGPPGVYQVQRDGQAVFALASAIPAQEADLQPLSPELLKDRLAGGRKVYYASASGDAEPRDDRWAWLLVICAGCILGEWIALRLFRT